MAWGERLPASTARAWSRPLPGARRARAALPDGMLAADQASRAALRRPSPSPDMPAGARGPNAAQRVRCSGLAHACEPLGVVEPARRRANNILTRRDAVRENRLQQ